MNRARAKAIAEALAAVNALNCPCEICAGKERDGICNSVETAIKHFERAIKAIEKKGGNQ